MFFIKLAIFNGSPRGVNSGSKLIIEHFVEGLESKEVFEIQTAYLTQTNKLDEHIALFEQSEEVIIVFPLYFDSMPFCVKQFIEALQPFVGRKNNPALGFVVHSGFPEAKQSRFVEKYLKKLTERLGSRYIGTVIKGNTEGFTFLKDKRHVKKVLKLFTQLGQGYINDGVLDEKILKRLATPEELPGIARFFMNLIGKLGLMDQYWNMLLKRNDAKEKRFNKPYENSELWEKTRSIEME